MKQFKLIVSTPKGNMLEKDIFMLSLRGVEGSLAIMANHIPFITTTKAGEVKIYCEDGEEIVAEASSGMLKSNLQFDLRGRAGDCALVTAVQNRPHLGLCPGPSFPLQV